MGSSVLSSLILSAKRRPAVLNALSNCGLTSRKTTSKTPKTNNFSTLTKKWQRFSETTAFVPLVWPSSYQLICLKLLGEYFFIYPHSWIETKPEQTWPLRLTEIYSTPLEKKIISNLPKERHPFLMNKTKPLYTSRIFAFWCVSNCLRDVYCPKNNLLPFFLFT